jgi:hypothetical protein
MRKFLVHTLAQHWLYADYVQSEIAEWMTKISKAPTVQAELLETIAGMREGQQHVEIAPLGQFLAN